MPAASSPSALEQKILLQEAPGGEPARLNVVAPSVVRPGESFSLRIAVLDETGYPSVRCDAAVDLVGEDGTRTPSPLRFEPGSPAVGSLEGLVLDTEQLVRHAVRVGDLEATGNATLCTREDVPRVYWGDPHVHTTLSACHADKCRSLNFCYTAGRHVTGLDWVAAADHVSNGRCEASKWKEQRTVSELYDDPPAFATLPAYEASLAGGAGGDNNVYMLRWPEIFADAFEDGTVRTLCARLGGMLDEEEFFIVPHHTTRTGKHGEIPEAIYPGAGAMPLIEIHSKWGTSEYRGNPTPLEKIHEGPSYAQDLLNRGLRFGFIAGTDTHASIPSGGGTEPNQLSRPPGLTAVLAGELSRSDIFGNLKNRRAYACAGERILLHGTVAGGAFGELRPLSALDAPRTTRLLVAAPSPIETVEIIRNGEVVHALSPGDWRADLDWTDDEPGEALRQTGEAGGPFAYYYVRATCRTGARAWSSPVWFA